MRVGLILVMVCGFLELSYAQNFIRLTDLTNQKTLDIKRKQFVQCRYEIKPGYSFLAGGLVRDITDSALVYATTTFNAPKLIPLSAITNLDRISAKRAILPGIVLGTVVGFADLYVNRQRSPVVSTLLGTAAIVVGLNYMFKWDRRHLNRNQIGKTARLQVILE